MWPVAGVIGENGGFYFRYHDKKMHRHFAINDSALLAQNKNNLKKIEEEVLKKIPGCAIASDQFCRMLDLAVDFCEDVLPLAKPEVQKIVDIFKAHGAQAKVSSIHVNGWFGTYDKLTTSLKFLKNEFSLSDSDIQNFCAFSGDSPNDEPMFAFFKNSFGVANIKNFIVALQNPPAYVATKNGGHGFVEIADRILAANSIK
jgi:hydroxymethylpyrimidine pyrophosphatase-like HAD family hydrolase